MNLNLLTSSPLAAVAFSLAILALGLTALSLNVSRLRLRHRVSFGDNGHKDLQAATRAHGNALEQVLLYAVLALPLSALPAAPAGLVAGCAGVFVAARVVHAAALLGRRLLLRQIAHVVSTGVHVALALLVLRAVLGSS